MRQTVWILGAPDPEMERIERLIRRSGMAISYALDARGERVRPETAYRTDALDPIPAADADTVAVECDGPAIPVDARRVDHHRPGDPGYGRPPEEFLAASSLGQVLAILAASGISAPVSEDLVLAAAADHCLAAAYRGECPGVDPDALMRWRVETRAAHQQRPVDALLADIEAAREAIRQAPMVMLGHAESHDWCDARLCAATRGGDCYDDQHRLVWPLLARDLRGRHVPELPEAGAREGVCIIADGLPGRDGRTKIVCQSGGPRHVEAFLRSWAPAHGLHDCYGDPARGFAGGYVALTEHR